jgi:hypothetical protein
MTEAVFPLHVSQALDRLTVPSLPRGFNDRLAVRIASGDMPEEVDVSAITLPVLRRPVAATGWRRSGRIVFAAAVLGLATATAAAAGVFGEPVYIPVVSQALAKAQIVEMPVAKPAAKKSVKAESASTSAPKQVAKAASSGKDAVLALITELRADPAFKNLPREQRQERAKAEIAKLLTDGIAQKADVKAAWMQLAMERKDAHKTWIEQAQPNREKRLAEAQKRTKPLRKKPLTPEQKAKMRDAFSQLSEAQRAELQVLRQRRRHAAQQERQAINREIRAFWQRAGVKPGAEAANSETP